MTLASERSPRRFGLNPYLTTGLALSALIAAVLLLDSHPLLRSARGQLWGLNSLHHAEFDRKLPARGAMHWYVGVGPGELQPEAAAPIAEPAGGLYDGPVSVSLRAPAGADVRCTIDGAIPTQRDRQQTGRLALTSTTVLRCRSFLANHQPSPTATHTYLIESPGALPVLALTVDPTNLWNKHTGIYQRFRERGSEWERDAHVEFFPRTAAPSLVIEGRLRIHGFYSRSAPKKSLRLYYDPLPTELHDAENLLTWRTPAAKRAVILGARESKVSRDELFQSLYSRAGGHAPANMPVFLYLNAQPWGIYYVRERIDEEFLHRRVGPGAYDLLDAQPGRPRVLAGDRREWDRTVRFFETTDFSDPRALDAAERLIDLDNFTRYWLFNIYAANRDWPHHNMNMFRQRDGGDGRWRWISWDADATFDFMGKGLTHDTLAWATRAGLRHDLRLNHEAGLRDNEAMLVSTLIARKLLENPAYRERFVRQMRELLETDLQAERVMGELEAMHATLAADLAQERKRWSAGSSEAALAVAYDEDMALVKRFIAQRPGYLAQFFAELESGKAKSPAAHASCASCAPAP